MRCYHVGGVCARSGEWGVRWGLVSECVCVYVCETEREEKVCDRGIKGKQKKG